MDGNLVLRSAFLHPQPDRLAVRQNQRVKDLAGPQVVCGSECGVSGSLCSLPSSCVSVVRRRPAPRGWLCYTIIRVFRCGCFLMPPSSIPCRSGRAHRSCVQNLPRWLFRHRREVLTRG